HANFPVGKEIYGNLVKRLRQSVARWIAHETFKQAVLVGKLLIRSKGKEVLARTLHRNPIVWRDVGITRGAIGRANGLRVKTQVFLDIWVYGHVTDRAGGNVGHVAGANRVGNCELG